MARWRAARVIRVVVVPAAEDDSAVRGIRQRDDHAVLVSSLCPVARGLQIGCLLHASVERDHQRATGRQGGSRRRGVQAHRHPGDRLGRPRAGAAGRAATRSTAAVRAAGQGLESRGTGDRLSGGSCDGQARHRQAGRQERADCALSDTREHASSLRRRPGHRPGRHRTVVPVGARASLSSERMPRCVIARHSR